MTRFQLARHIDAIRHIFQKIEKKLNASFKRRLFVDADLIVNQLVRVFHTTTSCLSSPMREPRPPAG